MRNVYGCDPPFLRGNDGVNGDYVVKDCTVRGDWNTAKRIAVQNRNRSGTDPVQKWYKTGTEVRHLQGGEGTNRSEGNRD